MLAARKDSERYFVKALDQRQPMIYLRPKTWYNQIRFIRLFVPGFSFTKDAHSMLKMNTIMICSKQSAALASFYEKILGSKNNCIGGWGLTSNLLPFEAQGMGSKRYRTSKVLKLDFPSDSYG